jgi:hypothetical protein
MIGWMSPSAWAWHMSPASRLNRAGVPLARLRTLVTCLIAAEVVLTPVRAGLSGPSS